jgi:hypothetical protein
LEGGMTQMPPELGALKHIRVLMLENRSFDHMVVCLKVKHPKIDGLIYQATAARRALSPWRDLCLQRSWVAQRGRRFSKYLHSSKEGAGNS